MKLTPYLLRPVVLLAAIGALNLQAAGPYNNGNSPAFIVVDLCSNGIGDQPRGANGAYTAVPKMSPNVFDIGLDVDADGTVDRWLSQEPATWLGGGNADKIQYDNDRGWVRLYFFQLSQYVGRKLKIVIVDKSTDYYMAIKSIRINGADGTVVPNALPNGFFENGLAGWTVKEKSVPSADSLVVTDVDGTYLTYGKKFFSTRIDPASEDSSATAVLESSEFVLPAITSFVYANVSGGASEFVNNPGSNGSDNASGVYLDLGTATSDPNGKYDAGKDLALEGFWPGPGTNPNRDFGSVVFNTSGLEGRRAQVVAFDNSTIFSVAIDGLRMNWDWEESIIKNGGFDQGIPTPQSNPNAVEWFAETGDGTLTAASHPSGLIPGWKVTLAEGATGDAYFFDNSAQHDHMTGRTFVGTGGGDLTRTGVEIRSDVFQITAIPAKDSSVFVQFASAQGSDRVRYRDDGSEVAMGRIELIVDVNKNGTFGDDGDFTYVERNQGMAMNQSNSGRDLWHFPQYRWYIKPEHQGLKAQFRAQDSFGQFKSSWAWLCVDNVFVWDGAQARLAFPNSDFEQGTLDNWTASIASTAWNPGFSTWLSGSLKSFDAGIVNNLAMNDRSVSIDGDFAADTAANEVAGADGDAGTGVLTSMAFELPKLAAPTVSDLVIAKVGGVLTLTWTGAGELQTTSTLGAGFSTVVGATSPYVIPVASPAQYYRLAR